MTFNTPATPHKGIVRNQETDKNIRRPTEEIQEWRRITTIPCQALMTQII